MKFLNQNGGGGDSLNKDGVLDNIKKNKKKYLKMLAIVTGTIVVSSLIIRYCKNLNAKISSMENQLNKQKEMINRTNDRVDRHWDENFNRSNKRYWDLMDEIRDESRRRENENNRLNREVNDLAFKQKMQERHIKDHYDIHHKRLERLDEDTRSLNTFYSSRKSIHREERVISDIRSTVREKIGFLKTKKKRLNTIIKAIEKENMSPEERQKLLNEADSIGKEITKAQNEIANIWKRAYKIGTRVGFNSDSTSKEITNRINKVYSKFDSSYKDFDKNVGSKFSSKK